MAVYLVQIFMTTRLKKLHRPTVLFYLFRL